MHLSTAATPAPAPDAGLAAPQDQPDRPQPAQATRTGPLRSGNPRGNPNLAPRCGAKARTTGSPCRAPAMPNGRCRMHGGKSTGARTPEGFASLARAHTTHGRYAQSGPHAELRAEIRHARVVDQRVRLNGIAFDHLPWLPPALAVRLHADTATELHAPAYHAWIQTACHLTATPAATPKPEAPANTPCNLQPPDHNPTLQRDARGRFAARPKPALRGRKAEREAARLERERLAPWRAGIKRARLIKRLLMHQAQNVRRAERAQNSMPSLQPGRCPDDGTQLPAELAARGLPVEGPRHNATLAQNARIAIPRTNPAAGRTAANPTGSAGLSASSLPDADPRRGDTTAPGTRFKPARTEPLNPETAPNPAGPNDSSANTSIQRGTVAPSTGPAAAANAGAVQHPLQRGAGRKPAVVATAPNSSEPPAPNNPGPTPATQPRHPQPNHDRSHAIRPGTVRRAEGPFRRALLSSTASNVPDADKFAMRAERAGGWPVMAAAAAAKHAGLDWRPAATAVRQRLIDDANRARARQVPRLAPEPDPARAHGQPVAPR